METQYVAKLGTKNCHTCSYAVSKSDKLHIEKYKESTIEQRIVVKMQFYSHHGM